MTALLTSTGFGNPGLLVWAAEKVSLTKPRSATIITTAARLKEKNEWAQKSHDDLLGLGIPAIRFFDFETQDLQELEGETFILVNGGNTFRLMHGMALQNTRAYLDRFFARGGIYIGVSAGSAVMGHRIDHLSLIGMDEDEYDWGEKPALGYINEFILPHADERFIPAMDTLREPNVTLLKDGEAAVLDPLQGRITRRLPA